jgi:hypothetical protein
MPEATPRSSRGAPPSSSRGGGGRRSARGAPSQYGSAGGGAHAPTATPHSSRSNRSSSTRRAAKPQQDAAAGAAAPAAEDEEGEEEGEEESSNRDRVAEAALLKEIFVTYCSFGAAPDTNEPFPLSLPDPPSRVSPSGRLCPKLVLAQLFVSCASASPRCMMQIDGRSLFRVR